MAPLILPDPEELAILEPNARTPKEEEYDAIVKACVRKRTPHRQKRPNANVVKYKGTRLYTVTTIAASDRFGGTRTVAVCATLKRAKTIVEKNMGDIYECSYMLVVIEAVVADWLYGGTLLENYWYKWYGPGGMKKGGGYKGSYKPIEIPEAYKNVFGFGIGLTV